MCASAADTYTDLLLLLMHLSCCTRASTNGAVHKSCCTQTLLYTNSVAKSQAKAIRTGLPSCLVLQLLL